MDKAGNMASVAVLTNDGSKLAGPEFIQYSAQPLGCCGWLWMFGDVGCVYIFIDVDTHRYRDIDIDVCVCAYLLIICMYVMQCNVM